ncbi:MAG: hypothetical protein WBP38_14270 [Hyphomicrobium sp.]
MFGTMAQQQVQKQDLPQPFERREPSVAGALQGALKQGNTTPLFSQMIAGHQ